tara:strand:+ start:438 stop:671 length:234 start_codon:yes stop_codon:yes gene_type:complete
MRDEFFENNIHFAMLNSYDVIVNGIEVEDIMGTSMPFIAHNPFGDIKESDVQGMIDYFEEQEEYERCIKLKEILNGI